jgi:hypothetical protein
MRFRADGPRGPGERSAGTRRTVREDRRTVRYSLQNGVLLGGPGGRSAARPRIVRVAQADGPPGPTGSLPSVDFAFFTVGIQTRTVREGIADSPRGTRFAPNG